MGFLALIWLLNIWKKEMFFLLLLTLGQERCLILYFVNRDMALQCVQHWNSGTQVSYSWWAVPSCLACIRTQELFGGIGLKIPCEPCFWGIGEQQEWAALWGKAGWELRVTRGRGSEVQSCSYQTRRAVGWEQWGSTSRHTDQSLTARQVQGQMSRWGSVRYLGRHGHTCSIA